MHLPLYLQTISFKVHARVELHLKPIVMERCHWQHTSNILYITACVQFANTTHKVLDISYHLQATGRWNTVCVFILSWFP